MISICAPTFDTAGQVISYNGAAIQQTTSRRATRVPTLDLSATLVDGGFSVSDLTFQVRIPDSDGTHHLALTRMLQYHSAPIMSCSRGCYVVLLSNLTYDGGLTICTAEVLEAA